MAPHSKRPRPPRAGDYLPSLRPDPDKPVQSLSSQKAIFAAGKAAFARSLKK